MVDENVAYHDNTITMNPTLRLMRTIWKHIFLPPAHGVCYVFAFDFFFTAAAATKVPFL